MQNGQKNTTGRLIEEYSDKSSYERSGKECSSQGTGSLFSEHLMTGNQGEIENGKEIKVEGNKKIANYSP